MRDANLLDCYRLLELQPGATAAEVREAYRVLSRVWHPDRFAGNPEMVARATARQQELNDAYRRITQALQSGEAPQPGTRAPEHRAPQAAGEPPTSTSPTSLPSRPMTTPEPGCR